MSESQFAYSGLTLDELRALAASPQVGTLHAMPQSFRALADRVGEVADLLTHTQVNMHHWWKGPAAEQAAAMLGQAAAEAREFHDTAMGAATAVSHCAQIVSEQQHQMMNVPEVAEPGVTDVVPRPTTPFEALEAARRDAAYQAAHEQAVQVVNGIAAQYVETRSRLSEIGTFSAENFALSTAAPRATEPPAEPTTGPLLNVREPQPRFVSAPASSKSREAHFPRDRASASPKRTHREWLENGLSGAAPQKANSPSREVVYHDGPQREASQEEVIGISSPREGAASKTPTPVDTETPDSPSDESKMTSDPASLQPEFSTPVGSNFLAPKEDVRHTFERDTGARPGEIDSGGPRSGEAPSGNSAQSKWPNNDNTAMIPPYTGVGSVHRTREERNRRPAYLKERKSAWVTEKIAAPADGILTPDWFERH